MKRIVLFTILICLTTVVFSQEELNCTVTIITDKTSATNKDVYEKLKPAITEFMNSRKWTTETFATNERIKCAITLDITEHPSGTDEFSATMVIMYSRPVYKSDYESNLLNFLDKDIHFKYSETQPLEFSETTYMSNLTSILAFYAYMIIGIDFDSFSTNGGTPYFQKALMIVNNAQTVNEKGWKAFDGDNNRYWMVNNMLDPPYIPLRQCVYNYHRQGLDIMYQDADMGRKVILESIESLMKVHNLKPLSFSMRLFFNAKSQELIDIFSAASAEEKTRLMSILKLIDLTNINRYEIGLKIK